MPLDLEWKIVYVGSAEDEQYDQTLDCIMVGPVPVGVNKFVYQVSPSFPPPYQFPNRPSPSNPQADAPNHSLIPPTDITGVTVVLLTCSYRGQEFVRVGYYVNNEYDDEALKAEPPATPIIEKLVRNILADKPRVTRFPIKWDRVDELETPPPQIDAEMAGSDAEGDGSVVGDNDDDDEFATMEEDETGKGDLMSEDLDEHAIGSRPQDRSIDRLVESPEHQSIAPLDRVFKVDAFQTPANPPSPSTAPFC